MDVFSIVDFILDILIALTCIALIVLVFAFIWQVFLKKLFSRKNRIQPIANPSKAIPINVSTPVEEPPVSEVATPEEKTVFIGDGVFNANTSSVPNNQITLTLPNGQIAYSGNLENDVVLGRSQGCTVTLEDAEISRTHCRIHLNNGACALSDMESTNGVYLNDTKLNQAAVLVDGDIIKLGQTTLVVTLS